MAAKLLWSVIWINSLLFVALILVLGTLQMPVADDLIYLRWVNELGIWESTMLFREEWNTRWTAVLINQAYLKLIPIQFTGLAFQTTTLLLSIMAFMPISKAFLSTSSKLQHLGLSIYLSLGLFLLCFGVSDSWFWMCAQPAYLWASLIATWGIVKLFTRKPNPILYPTFILAHMYVGGASELVAGSVLLVEISLAILALRFRLHKLNKRLLVFGIIALMGSMIFAITGKGVEVRYSHLPHPGFIDGLHLSLINYLNTLIYGIGKKLPEVGLIIITVMVLKKQASQLWFNWKIPFGIADGVLIFTILITAFTLGEIGPNRAFVHVSTMVLILSLIAANQITVPNHIHQKAVSIAIVSNLIFAAYLVFVLVQHFPEEMRYAAALKQRNSLITNQMNTGATEIQLPPLPSAKYLYRAEISTNPASQNNQQLSTIYGRDLKFVLVAAP